MDTRIRCPGCRLELSASPGTPAHRYFNTSPECWAVFGKVLATQYSDAILFAATHQLSVDSYAAQHAGGPHPHKSVAIHLVGLHLVLEAGLRPTEVPARLQALATNTTTWPSLPVPSGPWKRTILDVALADDQTVTVRAWADEVWQAWTGAHGTLRTLASFR
jgi:hypothetical protein